MPGSIESRLTDWEDLFRREIAPWADAIDEGDLFPERSLRTLADAGCASVGVDSNRYGSALPADDLWRFHEALSAACGTTWFILVQHIGATGQIAATPNPALRDRWLDDLLAGRRWMGVAFGHLRRPEPVVRAVRVDGGWEVSGTAPWVTGWPILDAMIVGARTSEGGHWYGVVETRSTPGCIPSDPLRLAAMQASRTVAVQLDRVHVPDDAVLRVASPEELSQGDRSNLLKTIAPLSGVAGAACALGRSLSKQRGLPDAEGAWDILFARRNQIRGTVLGELATGGDLPDRERLRLRTEAIQLAVDTATAAVVSAAGNGMIAGKPAQRLLREAAFYSVFQQTSAIAAATLERTAARWR
ncbi:MAG: acyl-CoA dehydrogenase family protein [Armatimonadota bacterium]